MAAKLKHYGGDQYGFHCPGCGNSHVVPLKLEGTPKRIGTFWDWNGSLDEPDIVPSIRVQWGSDDKGKPLTCHLYVKNGQLMFMGDCFHRLKGKTVPMVEP